MYHYQHYYRKWYDKLTRGITTLEAREITASSLLCLDSLSLIWSTIIYIIMMILDIIKLEYSS